ncbi:MAG: glycine dehydrogenase, partial [Myxococcota bacterium]|nr:glycine dehydrogenase [Myxococcota bacterium]
MAFTPELTFVPRHIGPGDSDIAAMLKTVGFESLDSLIDTAVPESIRLRRDLDLGPARTEHDVLATLKDIMSQNRLLPSYIGLGYHGCITPPVIQRNILENPGWYTQYTPYQAEIAQGRLEMLFNYQTMVSDLTGLPCANASLLDEGTAAAEAMSMSLRVRPRKSEANRFFISDTCHPQTIEVVKTRAAALGVETVIGCHTNITLDEGFFGLLLQYPTTNGDIPDYRPIIGRAHECGAVVTLAADILALALITSPGELGADIAVGSTQRLGIPMGYGGPHAAYFATRDQWKRQLPGRIIGLSKDVHGAPALRMALQTREQHIRRDRATSNICTAQVLLAIMAGAYGIYHGPDGIRREAQRVYELANALRGGLKRLGLQVDEGPI